MQDHVNELLAKETTETPVVKKPRAPRKPKVAIVGAGSTPLDASIVKAIKDAGISVVTDQPTPKRKPAVKKVVAEPVADKKVSLVKKPTRETVARAPAVKQVKPVKAAPASVSAKHKAACLKAWGTLVAWQGTQAELGRVLGVSRVAVQRWKTNGAVGKEAAIVVTALAGCPLTFAQIRPDIPLYYDAGIPAELAKRIKQRTAFLVARDKAAAKVAKSTKG